MMFNRFANNLTRADMIHLFPSPSDSEDDEYDIKPEVDSDGDTPMKTERRVTFSKFEVTHEFEVTEEERADKRKYARATKKKRNLNCNQRDYERIINGIISNERAKGNIFLKDKTYHDVIYDKTEEGVDININFLFVTDSPGWASMRYWNHVIRSCDSQKSIIDDAYKI